MTRKPKDEPRDPALEYFSGKPRSVPLRTRREPSLAERIRKMVRSEQFEMERERAGEETFDEADDFDVGDDFDPQSPYEEMFDGEFEYHREQRLEAQKEETQSRRRGTRRRKAEANDKKKTEDKEISPEPTLTKPPGGSAE